MGLTEEIESLRREVAELRAALDRQDDWAGGLLAALQEALIPLLRTHPDIALVLEASWRDVPARYEALLADTGQAENFHETADLLEPRKMLYRTFSGIGLFPPPWSGS